MVEAPLRLSDSEVKSPKMELSNNERVLGQFELLLKTRGQGLRRTLGEDRKGMPTETITFYNGSHDMLGSVRRVDGVTVAATCIGIDPDTQLRVTVKAEAIDPREINGLTGGVVPFLNSAFKNLGIQVPQELRIVPTTHDQRGL